MTSVSWQNTTGGATGMPNGASAEMNRHSRPMSWAVASTIPSGGRRRANGVPSASMIR
jgi:hypothetical protein